MVYKRYIKRGGKLCGPYYYESYRNEDGKIISKYLKNYKPPRKILVYSVYFIFFVLFIFIILALGNLNYNSISVDNKIIGKTISTASSDDLAVISQIGSENVSSDISDVNVEIKNKVTEANRIIEFETPEGNIELSFDLMNYSKWVETENREDVEAENFDVDINESSGKYKWGYDVKLKELNFMAKIEVSSDLDITILDNKTLRIGNNFLSFKDLYEKGYTLVINEPVVLGNISVLNLTNIDMTSNITSNFSEMNVSEVNVTEEVINGTNVSEEVSDINMTVNETDENTGNMTGISEGNDSGGEEDSVSSENEINESISDVNVSEEIIDSEIEEDEIGEDDESEDEESVEEQESEAGSQESEDAREESIEEEVENEDSAEEESEEEPMITEPVINIFLSFVLKGFRGLMGFVVKDYENKVSVYVQRDFGDINEESINNTQEEQESEAEKSSSILIADVDYQDMDNNGEISVGDIINLDPELIRIQSEPGNINSCQELNESGTYVLNQSITGISGDCFIITADDVVLDGNGFNITGDLSGSGVSASGRNNIIIKNFSGINDFFYGVYFEGSSNNNLTNIITNSNQGYGIYLWLNSHYINLADIIANSNGFSGVYFFQSLNNTLSNITTNENGFYGVDASLVENSNLTNIITNSNDAGGIYLYSSSENIFKNVTANSNEGDGILVSFSSNNLFLNLTLNKGRGIRLNSFSNNNSFLDISMESDIGSSLNLDGGSNNTFENLNIWNCSSGDDYPCIKFSYSEDNRFVNGIINFSYDNLISVEYSSNGNNFTSLILENASKNAVYTDGTSSNNRFYNLTISDTGLSAFNVTGGTGNKIINNSFSNILLDYYIYDGTIQEYSLISNSLEIYDSIYGSLRFLNESLTASGNDLSSVIQIVDNEIFVNTSSDRGFNTSANITLTSLYNPSSYPLIEVDWDNDGNFENCSSSVCKNLSWTSPSGPFVFNVTHFTSYRSNSGSGTNLTVCKELNQANEVYILLNNISTTGTCFTVTANNVTLDMNGFNITGDNIGADYGVYSNGYNETTIRMGKIYNFGSYGVKLVNNSNNKIINMTLNLNGYGIYLEESSDNQLINLTVNENSHGIFLDSSFNNTLVNIVVNRSGYNGVYLDSSFNNNLTNITTKSNEGDTFYLFMSSNNTFRNLNIWNCSYSCIYIKYGSSLNTFEDIEINKSAFYGIIIYPQWISTSHNLFKNINITNIDSYEIYLYDNLGSGNINNTFLNASYNLDGELIRDDSQLIRKWYYKAHVTDNSSTDVANASVIAYNVSGDATLNLTTNASGWTPIGHIIDYINDGGTRVYQSSYILAASNDSLWDSHNYNVSEEQNNLNDSFIVEEDYTEPVLSGANWSSTTTQTTIVWNTNEGSNSSVTYWASPATTVGDNGFVISHSVTLTGLIPNTTYGYYYTSCDFAGNCNSSSNYTFDTAEPGGAITGSSGGGFRCIPNWKCGLCEGTPGQEGTRNCWDDNNCGGEEYIEVCIVPGSEEGKSEKQSELPLSTKGEGCISNWNCSAWSECRPDYNLGDIIAERIFLNGSQNRLCDDLNRCSFIRIERRSCSLKIPISAKRVGICYKDFVEIRDLQSKLISRMELINETQSKLNIYFSIDDYGYCPYCYDGVKNYDEEERDCGGSCPDCQTNVSSRDFDLSYLLIPILFILITGLGILISKKRRLI
jgi:parallel beta-helix repeat protein